MNKISDAFIRNVLAMVLTESEEEANLAQRANRQLIEETTDEELKELAQYWMIGQQSFEEALAHLKESRALFHRERHRR